MKKVIFDVDGVLLSEKRYFDVSALTVWEWYHSPLYLNLGGEQIKLSLMTLLLHPCGPVTGRTMPS